MTQTQEQIRQKGLEALRKALGPAGMIRFLQQLDQGHGDYARERHAWVDSFTQADLKKLVRKRKQPSKPKQPK